jgi:hypothetical protein
MSTKSTTTDQPDLTPATTAHLPAVIDASPALPDFDNDPWAGVADGDLSPATARSIPLLVQNRKSDGGILDEETGEVLRSIDFVWLAKSTSRAWWPLPFGKGEAIPTCRSADGIVPDPLSPEVQNPACATCPQARWDSDDPTFRRCADSIEALIFLPQGDAGRLARIRFGGLALKPAQNYWDSFMARMPRRPPIAFVSHMELVPTETPNGTFLVPAFRRVLELRREDAQPLIEERDRRLEEWTSTVAEDVATGATREAEHTPTAAPAGDPGSYEPTTEYGSEPF